MQPANLANHSIILTTETIADIMGPPEILAVNVVLRVYIMETAPRIKAALPPSFQRVLRFMVSDINSIIC